MKRLTAILLLACAGATANAAGWTNLLTVERGFTENSDFIVIYTVESGVYTPGCSAQAFMFRADSETRRARAWSTILTALTTGQKIQLWYTDTCATWGYHDVTAIMLHKGP